VIPNLQPLFESPKLDRELRNLIRDNFREFLSPPANHGQLLFTSLHPVQGHILKKESDQRILHCGWYFSFIFLISKNNVNKSLLTENMDLHETGLINISGTIDEDKKILLVPTDQEIESVFSDETAENLRRVHNIEDNTDDDDDLPLSEVFSLQISFIKPII